MYIFKAQDNILTWYDIEKVVQRLFLLQNIPSLKMGFASYSEFQTLRLNELSIS